MPGLMKNTFLKVEISPIVIWRLKLFQMILRFAVWVGGFGGVEVVDHEEIPSEFGQNEFRQITQAEYMDLSMDREYED